MITRPLAYITIIITVAVLTIMLATFKEFNEQKTTAMSQCYILGAMPSCGDKELMLLRIEAEELWEEHYNNK